ncbi:MAG: hypothetical protein ACRDIW_01295 [Actinomycetota bacterium]
MSNGPYLVFGEDVFHKIDADAEDWVRGEFYDLAAEFVRDSRPYGSLPAKGLTEGGPPVFTAPFDDGFVIYIVRENQDPPEIEMVNAIWM